MEAPKQTDPVKPQQSIGSLFQNAQQNAGQSTVEASAQTEAAPEQPKKKKYYSPNEVMKKKGCIGCGGMTALAVLTFVAAAVIALI